MTLIDLLRSAWAIMPDRLDEIQAIYAAHFRGEKIDIDAIEARLGRPLANEQQEYAMRDGGVAVLPIEGVIAAKANLFTRISGGASAQMLTQQVQSMRADSRVRSAIIALDTPGGSVFGIPELAGEIRALATEKPVVAVSTGMMASAGYWIGSAANAVFASGSTDVVGSIGVVMRHTYDPRAKDTTTEIVAGRYKRIATDAKPLSAEGAAYLQQQVDAVYEAFVETVAENRRATPEQVLEHMADGRVFVGKQAKAAGLIDGFSTVDDMAERLASDPDKYSKRHKAVFALGQIDQAADGKPGAAASAAPQDEPVSPVATATATHEAHPMTPQEAAAQFAADNPEAAALLRAEGASAEIKRVADVRAAALPGHEKLIEALAADGRTSGAEAALAVLAAERQSRTAASAARAADAPAPIAQAPAEGEKPAEKPEGAAYDAAAASAIAKSAQRLVADARAAGRYLSTTEAVAQAKAALAA